MDHDILDLVSMTPEQAMELFLASVAQPDLPVNQIYVFKVNAQSGNQTRLDIYLKDQPGSLESWVYGGTATFTFNRLNLADFFMGIPLQFLPPSYPTTTAWLCNKIAEIGLINFDPIDFVQEDITQAQAVSYLLKAAPDSLRWVGQVPVSLYRQVLLFHYFLNAQGQDQGQLDDMISITSDLGIGIYSTGTNGVLFGSQLSGYLTGYTFTTPQGSAPLPWVLFNRILNQPNTWEINSAGPKPYNGYGATVTYNGPIDPTIDKPYNTNLTLVCRIKLNSTYCTNQVGTLSIYYNLSI